MRMPMAYGFRRKIWHYASLPKFRVIGSSWTEGLIIEHENELNWAWWDYQDRQRWRLVLHTIGDAERYLRVDVLAFEMLFYPLPVL